ncbi:MAG TPA: hypothetical protein VES40_03530 [Ilumatobacteraceae bacterium]|nr:hypothetical protein [Ilumatobacteraceae bacterium]
MAHHLDQIVVDHALQHPQQLGARQLPLVDHDRPWQVSQQRLGIDRQSLAIAGKLNQRCGDPLGGRRLAHRSWTVEEHDRERSACVGQATVHVTLQVPIIHARQSSK